MGKRYKDITKKRFERLEAIEYDHTGKNGHAFWKCRCDCGNYCIVKYSDLTAGHTKSCGCLKSDVSRVLGKQIGKKYGKIYGKENLKKVDRCRGGTQAHNYKHGLRHTRIYKVWTGMKKRCYNQNDKDYEYYGGRGIKVCEEWKNSPEKFAEWALSHGYDEHAQYGECTLDRIDVDKDYNPSNCRWITIADQQRNKRNTKKP